MADVKLPYVTGYGNITKALQKIQEASTPDRFTQDFLSTKLGLKGNSEAGHPLPEAHRLPRVRWRSDRALQAVPEPQRSRRRRLRGPPARLCTSIRNERVRP